jgi:AcrR family transcriptional regulator
MLSNQINSGIKKNISMSPYPSQTNREKIVETASDLIERDGVENLSLNSVAAELGIKAPSLYRYVESKDALLHAVIEQTYMKLFEVYDAALEEVDGGPIEVLLNLAKAHYTFAHQNPNTYMLAYFTANPDFSGNPNMLRERAIAAQEIIQEISGEENALPAYRGLLALVHGYVMLELNGQFRRGGDLEQMLKQIVAAYLKGWN